MFFLGAHVDAVTDETAIVVIEKTMKNIKNYYTVCAIHPVSAEGCQAVLIDLYRDPNYSVRKRVYSQDKRPKKDVRAHPKVVVAGRGERFDELLIRLRKATIPANGLQIVAPEGPTPPNPEPSGIGRDFFVSEADLSDTLSALWQQGRLRVAADIRSTASDQTGDTGQNGLPPAWERLLTGLANNPTRLFPETMRPAAWSLAAPLWFRENVRYRRSYQSSARSVRRFT